MVKVSFFCNSPLSLFSCISLDATKSDVECKVETGVEVKVQFGAVTEVEGEAITKVEAEVGTEAAASAKAELAAKLKSAVAGRVRTYVGRGLLPRLPPPACLRPVSAVGLGLFCIRFFTAVSLRLLFTLFRTAICDCSNGTRMFLLRRAGGGADNIGAS